MICVMGAGAFGTALAISFARSGRDVALWARSTEAVASMDRTRMNAARLPDVRLPDTVHPVAQIPDAADVIVLAVPMQVLAGVVAAHPEISGKGLVACCKGLSLASGQGPTAALPGKPAVLTGPSFADDIARGLPTALTLACADDAQGALLQRRLAAPNLRLYRTTDVIGAELGGALKNVIAIGCGAVMGAGLGVSARAALMTRGFAEMTRFAISQGAHAETLAGLSGLGDLTLTCTSPMSRNYRFGEALGRGETFDASITVEGAATAQALAARATREGIDMPITQAITAMLDGRLDVRQAMDSLLTRPLKEE